jgi:hypothetical protein
LLTLGFGSAPVLSAYAREASCSERLAVLQRAVALAAYQRARSLPTFVPKYAVDEQITITEQRNAVR